jgi:hypothetical protein
MQKTPTLTKPTPRGIDERKASASIHGEKSGGAKARGPGRSRAALALDRIVSRGPSTRHGGRNERMMTGGRWQAPRDDGVRERMTGVGHLLKGERFHVTRALVARPAAWTRTIAHHRVLASPPGGPEEQQAAPPCPPPTPGRRRAAAPWFVRLALSRWSLTLLNHGFGIGAITGQCASERTRFQSEEIQKMMIHNRMIWFRTRNAVSQCSDVVRGHRESQHDWAHQAGMNYWWGESQHHVSCTAGQG